MSAVADSAPLAQLVAMAGRLLVEQSHERLARRGWRDIPPSAGYVLLAARGGPTTGSRLAQLMRVSKQAASKALDQLEQRGFVERGALAEDGRVKTVTLTPLGRDLLVAVEEIHLELEREWAGAIGAETVEAIRGALTRILAESHGERGRNRD
ncbi:MarR family winged helix-turn-helix transcriptional regulator [Dactylosporangium sp. NPDC048998]|uniref:MarR family winged helix-turn-helix transcriptional regulator n=1 Tax=Dactylosporangium sp. NPDC048998 TaxID=3363976 RepID=UPI00371D3163